MTDSPAAMIECPGSGVADSGRAGPIAPPVEPAPTARRRAPARRAQAAGRAAALFVGDLGADVTAGVTVGLVALPLAMAFAIASGLPPEAGIYCAIVTGAIISAGGGSMVQIGGPTGAFVVVVAGIVATHGVAGLFMCTMMGGVMLVLLGLTGMGSAIRFIPRPVVVGFTNGIAVIIATTQLREFLGLTMTRMPDDFVGRMVEIGRALPTTDATTAALSVCTLLALILCATLKTRIPGTIVALVAGTAAAHTLGLAVATIDTRFHGIPSGWPAFAIPAFRLDLMLGLLPPAFTVAMLGGIESLMSATIADRMTGDRHNPNVELVAQGVANIASPLFGGLPATGAIARTATNVRSGAKTPVAGIVHALVLLGIVLWAAPLAALVPMPVLAAILLMVAWNMGDWAEIPDIFRTGLTDASVWAVTLALTIFADLTQAVEVGMALAALLFIRRVATTTDIAQVTDEFVARTRPDMLQDKDDPAVRRRLPRHRPAAVRQHRQAGRRARSARRPAADRDPAPALHDRDRRHRPARHRRPRARGAVDEPGVPRVGRARAAARGDAAVALRAPPRRRAHVRDVRRRAGAGARDPRPALQRRVAERRRADPAARGHAARIGRRAATRRGRALTADQSARSAVTGSMRVARRAGK